MPKKLQALWSEAVASSAAAPLRRRAKPPASPKGAGSHSRPLPKGWPQVFQGIIDESRESVEHYSTDWALSAAPFYLFAEFAVNAIP